MIPLIYFIVFGLSLYTLSVFPVQRRSFSICWRAGLVVLKALSFCLFVKVLISPSYLNKILAGQSTLGCRFFCSAISFCPEEFLLKDQLITSWGSPCVFVAFPLMLFNIFSLCLIFVSLINMCLGVFIFVFILLGTLWVSWT